MKKLKIAAVRSKDGKYHAIEISGEGPNPMSEPPPMIGQTIVTATIRGNGIKESGLAWAKTAKALRKLVDESEVQAADRGALKPLSMYVLTVDGEQGSWWVAARSMGEAVDVAGLDLVRPCTTVHCREAYTDEKVVLTGPRQVAGQDPIEIMRCVAEYRSRVIGWIWTEPTP